MHELLHEFTMNLKPRILVNEENLRQFSAEYPFQNEKLARALENWTKLAIKLFIKAFLY